jgi:hypothetical protein
MIRMIMQSSNATLRNLKYNAMVKRPVEPQIYCLRDSITRWAGVKYFLEKILICNFLL